MIKVYIGQPLTFSYLPILYPNLGVQNKVRSLFMNNVFTHYTEPVFELVDNPAVADYFLLPHDFFLIQTVKKEYIQKFTDLAQKYKKKVIVFAHGDLEIDIPIKNSIVFRIARYNYNKKSNEIMMPVYSEDLLQNKSLDIRHKTGDKPVVGFCGWARLSSSREKLSYYAKEAVWLAKNFLPGNKNIGPERQGMWFRQKAIKTLNRSPLVKTNFIIRESFSGHKATIKLDPDRARSEYINNIMNSDFVLAVKGGGNCSMRFYEALSLGRIPLLVDTDGVLPLTDLIDYKDFVIFVDYKDMAKIGDIVYNFYNKLSEEQYASIQQKCRSVFVDYLRVDAFFKQIPTLLKNFHA